MLGTWTPALLSAFPRQKTQQPALRQRLVLAGRREMEIEVVDQEVHGDSVIHLNFYERLIGDYLNLLALDRNVQILDDLINIVADLFFGIAIHIGVPGLFLHFVGELILGDIGGKDFVGDESAIDKDRGPHDRFDRATTPLRARWGNAVFSNIGAKNQDVSRHRPGTTAI